MTSSLPPSTEYDAQSPGVGQRYAWLTPDRQAQVRNVLLGIVLFAGLTAWVWHSFGPQPRADVLARKLRVVGVMTWLYALLQIADMRFWHSAIAERRRASGIPQSVLGWLFGQMLACFGLLYYVVTEDARWYVAGLALLLATFAAFPIRRGE